MTCIVGLVDNRTVYIGGDSLASNGYEATVIANPKVFKNGEFLIGVCGSLRAMQILHYMFKPPAIPFACDIERYLYTDFFDAIRLAFRNAGFIDTPHA